MAGVNPMALFGGGMPSISPAAASSLNAAGSGWSMGAGDWNVNLAGSGSALQGLAAGGKSWLLLAAAVGAAWLLLRK